MIFQSYLIQFLKYLEYQKRYSPHTLSSYQNDIANFLLHIEKTYDCEVLQDIHKNMIRDWLATLKLKKYATKSIVRKKNSLQSFFKYLLQQGILSINPAAALPKIKQEKRLVQHASELDMKKLFEHLSFPEGYAGNLHFLILHLLYLTGMRVSELTNCTLNDIDDAQQWIRVLGKGNKERFIPISTVTLKHINQFILLRTQTFSETDSPILLLSEKGKAITRQQVYVICRKYLSLATTLNHTSPHILRHTFATHLLENNAEINAIKELLGHSSLAATQIYTHVDMSKIKHTYQNTHPRMQDKEDTKKQKDE